MKRRNETKLELIVNGKRKYDRLDCKIIESVEDNGTTLKLFIDYRPGLREQILKSKITKEYEQ